MITVYISSVLLAGAQTLSDGAIFRQEGIASWYGAEFTGRPTASGEIFNPSLLTAAHPSLPFGTILRVTNTHNNKQAIVRINDRGPYVSSRIIDISQAAAEQLDMISTGTAPVVVESLAPVSLSGSSGALSQTLPSAPAAQSPMTPPASGGSVVPMTPAAPYQPTSGPAPRKTAVQTSVPTTSPAPPAPAEPAAPPATVPIGPPASAAAATVPIGPPVSAAEAGPAAPPASAAPAAAFPSRPVTSPQSPRTPVSAVVLPSMPPMGTGKQYRVQVGAYRVPRYASEAFDKLKDLGLNPAYERYQENYRVVISGVRPEQIPSLAEQLGTAGFSEILVREER